MKSIKITAFAGIALALLLVLGIDSSVAAQGRSGGSRGNSGNSGGGRPGGTGVDRGLGNASDRSNGRSDSGLRTASDRSNGRADDGIDRARSGRENGMRNMPTDNELNRYRGISRKLNTTPEALRSQYEAALARNPNLKFGQFVAANMIADNLGARNLNITASAILSGLQNGDSIGETLRDLGMSGDDAKRAEKEYKRQMKEAKKQN